MEVLNYYRKNARNLTFTTLKTASEIILTKGMVILDEASIEGCDFNKVELMLSYVEDGQNKKVKKRFRNFTYYRIPTGHKVDFMKSISQKCWINITEPTRLRFNLEGLGGGNVLLNYFIIRL